MSENSLPNLKSSPQCQFFVVRKKRLCRMTVRPGRLYCGEHEPEPRTEEGKDDTRIPCPYDPKHTCYISKLEKHLSICNARQTETPLYIEPDVNSPSAVEVCERLPLSQIPTELLLQVIEKVNLLYEQYIAGNISTAPQLAIHSAVQQEFEQSDRAESSRRHMRQASSLLHIAESAGLVHHGTCYVELGAGKGQLSFYIGNAWCGPNTGSSVVLIDRAALRHKRDNKLRECVTRIRADLKDLALGRVGQVGGRDKVVGFAKHLCGVATDYALRCMVSESVVGKTRGVVLATCCHHRCHHNGYVGNKHLQELGISGEELNVMLGIVSWATCGDGLSRDRRKLIEERQIQHNHEGSRQDIEENFETAKDLNRKDNEINFGGQITSYAENIDNQKINDNENIDNQRACVNSVTHKANNKEIIDNQRSCEENSVTQKVNNKEIIDNQRACEENSITQKANNKEIIDNQRACEENSVTQKANNKEIIDNQRACDENSVTQKANNKGIIDNQRACEENSVTQKANNKEIIDNQRACEENSVTQKANNKEIIDNQRACEEILVTQKANNKEIIDNQRACEENSVTQKANNKEIIDSVTDHSFHKHSQEFKEIYHKTEEQNTVLINNPNEITDKRKTITNDNTLYNKEFKIQNRNESDESKLFNQHHSSDFRNEKEMNEKDEKDSADENLRKFTKQLKENQYFIDGNDEKNSIIDEDLHKNNEQSEENLFIHENDQKRSITQEELQQQNLQSKENQYCIGNKQYRAEVGRRAKAVLDWGRVLYLRERGFDARLCYYVPNSVSLENVCLVATKHVQ